MMNHELKEIIIFNMNHFKNNTTVFTNICKKVIKVETRKEKETEIPWYFVHYKGWKSTCVNLLFFVFSSSS